MGPQSSANSSEPKPVEIDLVKEAQENYTLGKSWERDNDTRMLEDAKT